MGEIATAISILAVIVIGFYLVVAMEMRK